VIIPSVFPFLILTDIVIPYIKFENIKPLKYAFEKVFKISGCGVSALLCGLLCGFPIGARLAFSLYKTERISRDECERLMAISNNASPGYVISALGIGIRGSLRDGIILYLATVISAIITGSCCSFGKKCGTANALSFRPDYDFVCSVKESIGVCLNICGFVTTFSIFTGLIRKAIKTEILLCIILPFMEIGNAGAFLQSAECLSSNASLMLTAFATTFSGISVLAQTRGCIESSARISFTKYFLIKLLQGVISAVITGISIFFF
jgi:hypothetical protein